MGNYRVCHVGESFDLILRVMGLQESLNLRHLGLDNSLLWEAKNQIFSSICSLYVPAMQETLVQSMNREVPLEKEMATHSSILA